MGLYIRDGIWWMSYTSEGRRFRETTGQKSKKRAEALYYKVIVEVNEGKGKKRLPGEVRTFGELAAKYEAEVFRESKSWKSVQGYFNQLKEFFGPYIVVDITPAVISDFKQMRKTQGVAKATINRQLTILRRIFNLAKKRWIWIRDIPFVEMEAKADKKRVRFLSFEEFQRVLDLCDEWLKGIVIVAAWTGLRQGNILNLKKEQVNLVAHNISISSYETKNGENLTIPIPKLALEVLKESINKTPKSNPFVFVGKDNEPHYKVKVERAFKKALGAAGISDFRFHDLRHCFGSWNRQADVDIVTLADLMGHRDIRMTMRYAHIGPVQVNKATRKLEESYDNFVTIMSQSAKTEATESA